MSEPKDIISQIKENLRKGAYPNERTITTRIVMVFLRCLGWDVDNPLVVREEYPAIPDQTSKKVDLALFKNQNEQQPEIYIEVKDHGKIKNPEKEREAENQLWEYDRHNRVNLAILTDGQIWHFYYPFAKGTYSDRKAYSLDILARTDEDISHYLEMLLSFENIGNGNSAKHLKKLHEERTQESKTRSEFPEIWQSLLVDPNEYFLEGISSAFEQQRGFPPDTNIIKRILRDLANKEFFIEREIGPETPEDIGDNNSKKHGKWSRRPTQIKSERTRMKVGIKWKVAGKSLPTEVIDEGTAAGTLAKVIERLANVYGQSVLERLSTLQVSRGPLVTRNPNRKYQHRRVMGYFVLTHSATPEKLEIMRKMSSHLSLPAELFEVETI
jgi:hypothetical protein